MNYPSHSYIRDINLLAKDAGAVTSTGVGTVAGEAKVIDLQGSYATGRLIVLVDAIEVASNNELFDLRLEASNDETFATGVYVLARLHLGAAEVTGETIDTVTGLHVVPFANVVWTTDGDRALRYLRVRHVVSGTVSTGIDYSAWIVSEFGGRARTW